MKNYWPGRTMMEWLPHNQFISNQGWLCPRCNVFNSPTIKQCPSCEEVKKSDGAAEQ